MSYLISRLMSAFIAVSILNSSPVCAEQPVDSGPQHDTSDNIQNIEPVDKEYKIGTYYDAPDILEFLKQRNLNTIITSSTGSYRYESNRFHNQIGIQHIIANTESGEWALLFQVDGAEKIRIMAGGTHFDYYPERQNSFSISDNDPTKGYCKNLEDDFNETNDLVFVGLNDMANSNNLITIHAAGLLNKDAYSKDRKTLLGKAIIGSRTANGSCSGLFHLVNLTMIADYFNNPFKLKTQPSVM